MRTLEQFKEMAKSFGAADEKTQWFRDECQKRGYNVVFHHGINEGTALKVLDGPINAAEPALQAELAKPLVIDETVQ